MKTSKSWLLQTALMIFALLAVVWVMSLLRNPEKVATELLPGPAASPSPVEPGTEPIPAKVQFGETSPAGSSSK